MAHRLEHEHVTNSPVRRSSRAVPPPLVRTEGDENVVRCGVSEHDFDNFVAVAEKGRRRRENTAGQARASPS
jgi:hypothetical protein